MATQNGMIKISGKLGDLVFYNRKHKTVVRKRPIPYHQSENSIKSSQDFGTASRQAACIRKAFAPMVGLFGYNDLHNRLNKCLIEIFKTILAAHAGNKKLIDGKLELLKGFEFNSETCFNDLFFKHLDCVFEADGLVKLILPKSDLRALIKSIPKAEVAVIKLMIFNFDLQGEAYEIYKVKDLKISMKSLVFHGAELLVPTKQERDQALLIAIGISYFSNGSPFGDKRYYACKISHAFHLKDGVVVNFIESVPEQVKVVEDEEGLSWVMGSEDTR